MTEDSGEVGQKRTLSDDHTAGDDGAKRQALDGPSSPQEPDATGSEWVKHISKKSGKPFWYNSKTQASVWDDPLGPGEPPSPKGGASAPSQFRPKGGIGPSGPPQGQSLPPPAKVYPQRAGAERCQFYLQTGSCKYGDQCRYDHPLNREAAVAEQGGIRRPMPGDNKRGDRGPQHGDTTTSGDRVILDRSDQVPPLRPGQPECTFYMKTGMCKFGESCKYNHPPSVRIGKGMSVGQYGQPDVMAMAQSIVSATNAQMGMGPGGFHGHHHHAPP
eukprot:CAMPEP_0173394962 /NCGR_PEP_ID=MMETSP1356-20130122/30325_1 /TAXON_ID=77927 ORGANISM="Hemiselmis virescens, Strain PCC157" /NCGR_SAMPLE_ID=MMETSP1356 /ASSEMBLY_ACC=CAM_ASM_000847 /LENGTH=272 /DNA_ID=CAMNT_0014353551 /DNA_START=105 /DNA_END=920 /DNA_ORIENTATION=+